MAKPFKRDPREVEKAAEEALAWIEKQTDGLVIDCKDSLRLALNGDLRPVDVLNEKPGVFDGRKKVRR